jgi:hypothetical protein
MTWVERCFLGSFQGDITMRSFATMLGLAWASWAISAAVVQAQVVGVQITRPYTPIVVQQSYLPPVYVHPPTVTYSYYAPPAPVAPVTYSYYAPPAPVVPVTYSYYAPPAPVAPVTYSYYAAPAPAVVAPGGVYTTYTYRGYGVFRPRGTYSQTYYTPIYP